MLIKSIKTNVNNCKRGYKPLDAAFNNINSNNIITIGSISGFHNLSTNDEVMLKRIDGERIDFRETVQVRDIISDTEFTINGFNERPVSPSSYEIVSYNNRSVGKIETGETKYVKLIFSEGEEHIFCKNRDEVEKQGIKAYYRWDNDSGQYVNSENGRNLNLNETVYQLKETGVIIEGLKSNPTKFNATTAATISVGDVIYFRNDKNEYVEYTVLNIEKGPYYTEYTVDKVIDSLSDDDKNIYKEVEVFSNDYLCNGDYVLYDGTFLKQIEDGNTESEILNIKNIELYTIPKTYNSLNNCVVPINNLGYDNRYELLVPFEGNEWFAEDVEELFSVVKLYCNDTRFWVVSNNTIKSKEGTEVDKITGDIELDFSVGEDFSTDLLQRENFLETAKEMGSGSVDTIINYERYPYTPMYYSGTKTSYNSGETVDNFFYRNSYKLDEELKPVKKINFKLNFRTKQYESLDNDYYREYGSWNTDEMGFWNNYDISDDMRFLVPTSKRIKGETADLLGHLGFTDSDVFYQSDALKKSFLRLSFYDSPHRETQKLLFYSTIYFDTNMLYKNYCEDLAEFERSGKEKEKMFVYDDSISKLLDATLSCTDRFNPDASADGFYLHLFDKMVNGNMCSMVYLKVEFNNAKFGKTVPLIMPVDGKSNIPIKPDRNVAFPKDYVYENSQGINMSKFLGDMYIKVMLKYDYDTNNYVWFFPSLKKEEEITLMLFEPRIIGYERMQTILDDNAPNWLVVDIDHYFVESGDTYVYKVSGETEEEYTRGWPALYTTAVTASSDSLIKGTQLFNDSVKKKIRSIWIDGMKVSEEFVDEINGATTNYFQLPDKTFKVYNMLSEEEIEIKPQTDNRIWYTHFDESNKTFTDKYIEGGKGYAIHRVNYYFFEDRITKDNSELYEELYKGSKSGSGRNKKTIETTEDFANRIKPQNVSSEKTLPKGMFANIRSLRDVYFKRGIDTVGNGAFNYCQGLCTVKSDRTNGITTIGKNAFAGCRALKEVSLLKVVNILKQAFQGCYTLTNVKFNNGDQTETLKYIGCAAFGYTNIRTFNIPSTLLRIGNSAFRRCYHLTKITTSNGLRTPDFQIGREVFSNNSILKFVLKRVSEDDKGVLYKYEYGTNTPIPDILRKLKEQQIKSVYYDAKNNVFKTVGIVSELYEPTFTQYRSKAYWSYLKYQNNYVRSFDFWNGGKKN